MTEQIRIRMLQNVVPDLPFLAKSGTFLVGGKEYNAVCNSNGAISGECENGEYLGVKPGEFVLLSGPQWLIELWRKEGYVAN